MKYQVIDNFLTATEFNNIKNTITGLNFPWYYNNWVVSAPQNTNQQEDLCDFQFVHPFYMNSQPFSDQFNLLKPFLSKLDPLVILKIKANLTTRCDKIIQREMHIDEQFSNGKTAVFYLNSNNGKTVFEDGTEIDSVENRMLIFDARMKHAGTTFTNQKRRIVINFNYIEKYRE